MAMNAFSTIIHLRYQLGKRLLFTKAKLKIWLPQFLGVLFFIAILLFFLLNEGVITTIFFLLTSGDKDVAAAILFAILFSCSVTVIFYMLIIGTSLSGQVSFRKISYLPISPFSFYFSELLASFVDIWSPILLIMLLALIIGISSALSFGGILANIVFIISFLIMLAALSQFLIYLLNLIFKINQKSRLKNLFFFFLFLLLFFIIALPMILINKNLTQGGQHFSEFFHHFHLEFTPTGAAAVAFVRLNFHESGISILAPLLLLMGYTSVFFGAGYFFFKRSLLKTSTSAMKKSSRSKRLMRTEKILYPLFKNNAIFIAKELTYLPRSPRVIVFCIAGVLLMLVNLVGIALRHPQFNLMILIWLIYPTLLLSIDSPYVFSYDEKATKSYFFFPISFRDFIFSKNISVFLFIFIFQIFMIIAVSAFLHLQRIVVLSLSAILVVGYFIFSYLVIVNQIVIENPPSLKFNSIFGRSNTNIGLSFGGLVLILGLMIVFYILFRKSYMLLTLFYACLFLLATGFYFILLPKFSEKLANNQENFIKKISE